MEAEELKDLVTRALEDMKGNDIQCLDVRQQTDIADFMVVVSGTSSRHVSALVENVVAEAAKHKLRPIGVEGKEDGEWILVDLADVLVHVMLPKARDFYDIERLWSMPRSDTGESTIIEN